MLGRAACADDPYRLRSGSIPACVDHDQNRHHRYGADSNPALFAFVDRVRDQEIVFIVPDMRCDLERYAVLGLVEAIFRIVPFKADHHITS